jgi:hypothetical protein
MINSDNTGKNQRLHNNWHDVCNLQSNPVKRAKVSQIHADNQGTH